MRSHPNNSHSHVHVWVYSSPELVPVQGIPIHPTLAPYITYNIHTQLTEHRLYSAHTNTPVSFAWQLRPTYVIVQPSLSHLLYVRVCTTYIDY